MQEAQELQVRSLGWEEPLEEGIITHSNTFAWKIPRTEESQATVHLVEKSQNYLAEFLASCKYPTT